MEQENLDNQPSESSTSGGIAGNQNDQTHDQPLTSIKPKLAIAAILMLISFGALMYRAFTNNDQIPTYTPVAGTTSPSSTSVQTTPAAMKGTWVRVGKIDRMTPTVVYNNELYGTDSYTKYKNYKLIAGEWVEVPEMGASVTAAVVANNVLYGKGGSLEYPATFKLVENSWVKVGGEKTVRPALSYQDELYGRSRSYRTYKLVNDQWIEVGDAGIVPQFVYNNELYGKDEGYGFYKLVNGKWIALEAAPFPKLDDLQIVELTLPGTLDGEVVGYADTSRKIRRLSKGKWLQFGEAQPFTSVVSGAVIYSNELYAAANLGPTYKFVPNP